MKSLQRTRSLRAVPACAAALLLGAGLPGRAAVAGGVPIPGVGSDPLVEVTSIREARFQRTVRQMYDFSCGSAALATLLSFHYGVRTDENEVFREMWEKGDQAKIAKVGFSLLDMREYLRALHYAADGYKISLAQLEKAGMPAVALINLGGYKHFVVIQGLSAREVLVSDPTSGARAFERREFDAMRDGVLLIVRTPEPAQGARLVREWQLRPGAPLARAPGRDGIGRVTTQLPRANEF